MWLFKLTETTTLKSKGLSLSLVCEVWRMEGLKKQWKEQEEAEVDEQGTFMDLYIRIPLSRTSTYIHFFFFHSLFSYLRNNSTFLSPVLNGCDCVNKFSIEKSIILTTLFLLLVLALLGTSNRGVFLTEAKLQKFICKNLWWRKSGSYCLEKRKFSNMPPR